MKKHYNVVAAVIERVGKILCLQKGKTKYAYTSYKYEFPGGKIEERETPESALKREIFEEMNAKIVVEDLIIKIEHEYPDFSITLSAYLCALEGEYVLKEHQNEKWLYRGELAKLDWCEADRLVIEEIASYG